jgi:hypothetical protein
MAGMTEHKSRQPDTRKGKRAEYGRVLAVDIGMECDAAQWRSWPDVKPDGINRREWRKLCRDWNQNRAVAMEAARCSYLREYRK